MNILPPNYPESLAAKVANGQIPIRRVWGMLVLRSAMSFAMLFLVAAIYQFAGSNAPFSDSAAWWLWFVTADNIVCIVLMIRFGRLKGVRLHAVLGDPIK